MNIKEVSAMDFRTIQERTIQERTVQRVLTFCLTKSIIKISVEVAV